MTKGDLAGYTVVAMLTVPQSAVRERFGVSVLADLMSSSAVPGEE